MRFAVLLPLVVAAVAQAEEGGEGEDDDIVGMMPMRGNATYDSLELIEARGFQGQRAEVTTADGYKLTLFRVLPKVAVAGRPPVLLYHGLLVSSDAWLTDEGALPFVLAGEGGGGYDVWIANVRGNAYSRRHTTFDPDTDKRFWQFCWHEVATGDLPAVIDHVLSATGGAALHYVGHSMGGVYPMLLLGTPSTAAPYASKLRSITALAPAAFLSKVVDMVGPDGMVQEMADKFFKDLQKADKWELFPRADVAANGKQLTCGDLADFRNMCEDKLEEGVTALGGPYLPAGTSWRMIECFKQAADAPLGQIGRYNYSTKEENLKMYGKETPPSYNWGDVKVASYMFSAEYDQLIQPKDMDELKSRMGNVVADVRVGAGKECFDHLTFAASRQKSCLPARAALYRHILANIVKLDTPP